MRRVLPALSILLVLLTSLGLGHARGQVLVGGAIVLCSGERVVHLSGQPGEGGPHSALCPDMALSILAGHPPPPAMAALPVRLQGMLAIPVPPAQPARLSIPSAVRARGPPVLI